MAASVKIGAMGEQKIGLRVICDPLFSPVFLDFALVKTVCSFGCVASYDGLGLFLSLPASGSAYPDSASVVVLDELAPVFILMVLHVHDHSW